MHHESGDRPARGKPRHPTPGGIPSPLDAVRQLLAEKAKFEKWLIDLDAKRETTPGHVFDRVRTDYTGRLEGVLERLRSHSSAMREHAATLSKKLAQLSESEQGILDTRIESELRAQVGELSPQDWEKISKKVEKDLAKIKQDQALITSDLNELRGLLAGVDGQPAPPEATGGQPASTEAASAPDTDGGAKVDELAFLKSVIGTTPPAAQPAAGTEAGTRPAGSATPASDQAAVADEKVPAKPAAKLVETPPPGPTIRLRTGGEEPLAMHVTGSNPIVLRSSGVVEQPKTLKCAECSAMNYASEWYCERCGAELTSV